jgi:uncharacterized membrane protein YhaH (DUF805 family)
MNELISAYRTAWERSFDYTGRSSRPDFWWFYLANFLVLFVLNVLGSKIGFFWGLANIYVVAQILPSLPICIRRLRDAGKAWPWIFIGLIPIIGTIWLIVLLAQPSLPALA